MINQKQMRLALRTRLKTLSVTTTGSASLGATGTTFTRSTGSFLTDGFEAGMEVVGTGFGEAANLAAAVVVEADILTLTVDRTLVTESEGAGKVLSVGLPSRRAWENVEFDPTPGAPYIEEQFISGPSRLRTTKANGTTENEPMYRVEVHVPAGVGTNATDAYADAVEQLFKHASTMTLTNGDTLRVRADTGPYRGQLLQRKPGWATVPVTIPLRLYTINP